jgi:hypothetical protein
MPVSFLSPAQREHYGRFTADPSTEELARYFHLDDSDRAVIAEKRGDHNRLGFALQLTTVRFLGTFLDNPTSVPAAVLQTLGKQLTINAAESLADYAQAKQRFEHAERIRIDYGYRAFNQPAVGFRLSRWLYAQCWTGTERPSVLFDRATTWMLAQRVLLPGASVLERFVARLRDRVEARLWKLLGRDITEAQQSRLEALLRVPDGARFSQLDELRTGPVMVSSPALVRALERLKSVRGLGIVIPQAAMIPPSRIASLARFADKAKASAVLRLPKRAAWQRWSPLFIRWRPRPRMMPSNCSRCCSPTCSVRQKRKTENHGCAPSRTWMRWPSRWPRPAHRLWIFRCPMGVRPGALKLKR